MARVWEGWGVEGRMAAMREVHGEVVQRAWSANLRDLEYRRSIILRYRRSTMVKYRSERKGGVVALLHGMRRCWRAQDRSMG